jgi:chromosome segregation ATPase
MALFDRIKALFARKGETEKKIAFLSERRTALSQQRDRAYEEITQLEAKDQELRDQFKGSSATLTKRRMAGQLLQLRKDVARRQQMIGVLNQQVNVVSTHLHNLELVQQGKLAELPNSEQIADDAAAAEEMLAELAAQSELAETAGGLEPLAGGGATAGLSAEEAALFAELEAEGSAATGAAGEPSRKAETADQKAEGQKAAAPELGDPAPVKRAPVRQKPGAEPG